MTLSSADIERAAKWLEAWDAQGIHRTGTTGDADGAQWLALEAHEIGIDPVFEVFAFERLDPVSALLEIGGERIEAVPLFDAPPTAEAGVTGRLGPVGSAAEIGVAELSPRDVYSGEAKRVRRAGAHRALVVVCAGEVQGLGLLNAEKFRAPFGPPALHVSSGERDRVLAAAARGDAGRLVSHSQRVKGRGCNTVLTVPGPQGRGAPPFVVMTPRSSWWQSTAERGGGIVCWLETLRALVAEPPAFDVVMTANTGHELNHLGLDDFVARRPAWEQRATWVHYGANLGAAGGMLSVMSASDDLRELAQHQLAEAGHPPDTIAPKSAVPSGETRDIHKAGGRYLTLVGTNKLFHLPQDRWPHAINVGAVARIAAAAARMVVTLTR
jgi:hypothetical protein